MSAPGAPPRTRSAGAVRARGAVAYVRAPRLLVRKLLRAARRSRAMAAYRRRLADGHYLPTLAAAADLRLTVAMPVHRVAEAHLRAAIESVRAQSHSNWRLLILDDASPDAHVARVLAEAARDEPRISVRRRSGTGGIARASNELLDAADTEYVAFLDHDDLLHPRALEAAGGYLTQDPAVDWLYSDEDKVDTRDRHAGPLFKPAFSPLHLLAFNLVSHLRVVRKEAIRHIGGHRLGYEGAQDYDLALRLLAGGGRFAHLPGVLYHWRTAPRSMAAGAAAKPDANAAAARALREHLGRIAPATDAAVAPALAPASLFRWRLATGAPAAEVELLPAARTEPAAKGDPWPELVAAARTSTAPVVAGGASGLRAGWWEPLVAFLLHPDVALAAGRIVSGGRVVASGCVAGDDGEWHDPWAGLAATDPGYLNLALVPCPRHLPAPTGWVARREDLVRAWDLAPEAEGGARLALGLARSGLAALVDPATPLPLRAAAWSPAARCPAGLPPFWRRWAQELGLLP